jgi:hypothetical protein
LYHAFDANSHWDGAGVLNAGRQHVADPAAYQIRLLGILESSWLATLEEMGIVAQGADEDSYITTLWGRVADQAALLGILNLVYSLGLPLLSVEYLPDDVDKLA